MNGRQNKWGDRVVKKNFEMTEKLLSKVREKANVMRTSDSEVIRKAIERYVSR
jgi:hypothetical protein